VADTAAFAEFKLGVRMLRDARPYVALEHFRSAADQEKNNPYFMSFLGVSLARAERKWGPALELCETALSLKRNEAQFYLNLAEVYTSSGRREEALSTLDRALVSLGNDARIRAARQKLGRRRPPALPFLDRQNALNRYLGIMRHRIAELAGGLHLPTVRPSSPLSANLKVKT
jgi:Flp pilus assembly protein TadD